jgi:hypothetical protein
MRERYWPTTDPIGHRLHMMRPDASIPWLPIVGVVEDVRQWVVTPGQPTIYWATLTQPAYAIAVRTVGDPQALVSSVQETIRQARRARRSPCCASRRVTSLSILGDTALTRADRVWRDRGVKPDDYTVSR